MSKKKIGILTLYYKNVNYGALMQAFALQKKVSGLGFSCEQISYDWMSGYKIKAKYLRAIFRPLKELFFLVKFRNWWIKRKQFYKIQYSFANSIPHTLPVKSVNIKEKTSYFEVFICGSDQIWNPIGWQPTFFLDFVPSERKKIAYAASISRNNLSNSQMEIIKNYTKDFYSISLRENNLVNSIQNFTGNKDICVMPDPVFLISADEWRNEALKKKIINEKYVLAYILGSDISLRNELIRYAELKNLKIVFIPFMNQDKNVIEWERKHSLNLVYNVDVREFLELIDDAELIVTDSFHVTAFSVIFEKPFYVFERNFKSSTQSMNSRIDTLLAYFKLENRFVKKDFENLKICSFNEEEKKSIENKLVSLNDKGTLFLKRNLYSL